MERDRQDQQDARERAVQEYYRTFGHQQLTCEATLYNFGTNWNRKANKVFAHHIKPYAEYQDWQFVHDVTNIILISGRVHDRIHYELDEWTDTETATKLVVSALFDHNWHRFERMYLPRNPKPVAEIWHDLLVSKSLIDSTEYGFSFNDYEE